MAELIFFPHKITKDYVYNHQDWLFLFGDNMIGKGMGGLAKILRCKANSFGIPTKHKPSMEHDAFFVGRDWSDVMERWDEDFSKLNNKCIYYNLVVPCVSIGRTQTTMGTGLARMPSDYQAELNARIMRLANKYGWMMHNSMGV